jgi:hypothetical protein
MVGDCGVARLYKDGIGAAYRTAKAAAKTAILQGISEEDFRSHYWPTCRAIANDNRIGKLLFAANQLFKKGRFTRKAILHMVSWEQQSNGRPRLMSTVLWDLFTGSAPYREILFRTFHPTFWLNFARNLGAQAWPTSWKRSRGGTK